MTRRELEAFKKQLRQEKTLLLQGITPKRAPGSGGGEPESGDVCDIASSDRERELQLSLSERDRRKLREIEEAFERIEDGTFGSCEACGCKIPTARLKIMPFTTVCVNCKSEMEKRSKLYQGAPDLPLARDLNLTELNREEED